MTFQFVHKYVTVIGTSFGARERWQFGLRMLDTNVPTSTNEAAALAIAPIIEAWWRAAVAPWSSNAFSPTSDVSLSELKVATIDVDGEYVDGTSAYSHFYLPPIVGGASKLVGQTPQDTLAVTLTTAVPRGLAARGRIYLPLSGRYKPGTDGLIPVGDATSIATSIRDLINAINALPEVGPISVMSKGKGVPTYNDVKHRVEYTYPNPGATNAVTGVRVGRLVDTQRRRRRQLVESPEAVQLS